MYCKSGQSTEEQMYNNEHASPAFTDFLDLIGRRVRLLGFEQFRGGLDSKSMSVIYFRDTSLLKVNDWSSFAVVLSIPTARQLRIPIATTTQISKPRSQVHWISSFCIGARRQMNRVSRISLVPFKSHLRSSEFIWVSSQKNPFQSQVPILVNLQYLSQSYACIVVADTTGTHSYYATCKGYEIMFHVSTMLPYTNSCVQQVRISEDMLPGWLNMAAKEKSGIEETNC